MISILPVDMHSLQEEVVPWDLAGHIESWDRDGILVVWRVVDGVCSVVHVPEYWVILVPSTWLRSPRSPLKIFIVIIRIVSHRNTIPARVWAVVLTNVESHIGLSYRILLFLLSTWTSCIQLLVIFIYNSFQRDLLVLVHGLAIILVLLHILKN